jgi:hypothetical protein
MACNVIFDELEWKSVYSVTFPNKPLPEKLPTLQEMIKLVAQLGGYAAHSKNSKPPGIETICGKEYKEQKNSHGHGKHSVQKKIGKK